MFQQIVVPLDGSPLAECVLPHVVTIGSTFAATVTLLQVLDEDHEEGVRTDPLQWQLRKLEAQAYLNRVQSRLQGTNLLIRSVVLEGPAAQRIAGYVHEEESDLLILSSHGRGGLAHWRVSGVVQKVIQDVDRSLLLVRAHHLVGPGPVTPGYDRIMVPLDGSKRAECTLAPAEALARRWGAELLLTHLIPRPRPFGAAPADAERQALLDQVIARHRADATHYFAELQARLPVRSKVYLGVADNVEVTLNELGEKEEVDLILFSAHGYGCSRSQRYGSLVSSCILYGSAPLLIVQDLPAEEVEPTAAERVALAEDEAGAWRLPGSFEI